MRMLTFLISLCFSTILFAQENPAGLNSALLNAILEGEARSVQIKTSYDLNVSKGELTLKALNFPSAPLSPVRAYINSEKFDITFRQNGKIASAPLNFSTAGTIRLQLNYEVPLGQSDPFTLIIPVVYPDVAAREASQEFFNAAIQIKGFQIHEAFPSATWTMDTKGDWNLHQLTLQAVPSMIKLKLGKGGRPLLSTLNLVDLAVILILVSLLIIGWKKIRQV